MTAAGDRGRERRSEESAPIFYHACYQVGFCAGLNGLSFSTGCVTKEWALAVFRALLLSFWCNLVMSHASLHLRKWRGSAETDNRFSPCSLRSSCSSFLLLLHLFPCSWLLKDSELCWKAAMAGHNIHCPLFSLVFNVLLLSSYFFFFSLSLQDAVRSMKKMDLFFLLKGGGDGTEGACLALVL